MLTLLISNLVYRWYRQRRLMIGAGLLAVFSIQTGCVGTGQLFDRNPEMDVTHARQQTNRGLEDLDRGNLDGAVNAFQAALTTSPDDRQTRILLARALQSRGDLQAAVYQMQRVAESSNDPRNHVLLGALYLANGQWFPAVRESELALSRNRKLPEAWVLRGKTAQSKGNLADALADYHRALGLNSDLPEVEMRIAQVYQKTNQPLRALATLDRLLDRYPLDQQPEAAVIAKGEALLALPQASEAIDWLAEACEREDASVDVYVALSRAQDSAGRGSDARTTLNRARMMFPQAEALANWAPASQRPVAHERVSAHDPPSQVWK